MDVVYEFIENVHVFIPIVAVVVIVLIIFVCGTSGKDKQPDPDYLNKLNQLEAFHHHQKGKEKSKNQQQQQQRSPLKPQNLTKVAKTSPQQKGQNVASVKQSDTEIRQRKNIKESSQLGLKSIERYDASADILEQDADGWVTVTPKRKPKAQKVSGTDVSDEYIQDEEESAGEMDTDYTNTTTNTAKNAKISSENVVQEMDEKEEEKRGISSENDQVDDHQSEGKISLLDEEKKDSSQEEKVQSPKQKKSRKKQQHLHKRMEPAFIIEEPEFTDKSKSVDKNSKRAQEPVQMHKSSEEDEGEDVEGATNEVDFNEVDFVEATKTDKMTEVEPNEATGKKKKKKTRKKPTDAPNNNNENKSNSFDMDADYCENEDIDDDEVNKSADVFTEIQPKKRRPRRE